MPMERRTRSSGSVRFSAGMEAWLMVHGISQRLFTLPNETVILKMRQASRKRRENSTSPVVRLIMEPWPRHCERWILRLCALQPPRPGKKTCLILGCCSRNSPTLSALSCARCTLRCMVLMPRRKRKHSKGDKAVPSAFCRNAMRLARSGSRTQTSPPVQSACPEKNFVAECTTMSTPSVRGLQITGGIMVLSTLSRTPCLRARAASERRSVMRIRGLEGLSVWMIFVRGVMALLTASRSVVSTKRTFTPLCTQSWVTKRCMPP
mmetsp:Transcript_101771/g.303723  ORF Transcript_101771/g.303723 Transcript_101771/m.303723 type:complete len:264 (+) Transcript_101771:434-1225(+)